MPDVNVDPEGFLGSMGGNLPANGERIVEEIQEIFNSGMDLPVIPIDTPGGAKWTEQRTGTNERRG